MTRVAVSMSVFCLALGMFISGMRIAQMAHNDMGAAPVHAQSAAERMWTNEFAVKALRIETFTLRRERVRLKMKKCQVHRLETLKICGRRYQQKKKRQRSEFIVSAAWLLQFVRVPLAVQNLFDMLEAQSPLELLQAHVLHTLAVLGQSWLRRYLQHSALYHMRLRSSMRRRRIYRQMPTHCFALDACAVASCANSRIASFNVESTSRDAISRPRFVPASVKTDPEAHQRWKDEDDGLVELEHISALTDDNASEHDVVGEDYLTGESCESKSIWHPEVCVVKRHKSLKHSKKAYGNFG